MALSIRKLHPMLKLPTDMPFNWRNDFGSVSRFIDILSDPEELLELLVVADFKEWATVCTVDQDGAELCEQVALSGSLFTLSSSSESE
mmetsp:Transcript_2300/g.3505  ORF Transcript_2300/g.3505 Transcript_2300/m.3505 type:complete len:88 (+) Transcript_2300:2388-2651(+)